MKIDRLLVKCEKCEADYTVKEYRKYHSASTMPAVSQVASYVL